MSVKLIFLGKKSKLDTHIQDYIKRLNGKVEFQYQKKLQPRTKVVVGCDENGKSLNSHQFLLMLEKYHFNLDIVVGEDEGLPNFQYTQLINLAPFVLAHDLARLVLSEQVYRAYSIFDRHPYHRA